ncbi:TonB-dependent receptor [Bacteroides acidifaciens]|uniref:TonB-dependent receptor n=1 Tax=Bacteroides acidifaciens TaxID=85831 RepID=UPI00214A567F|nr:TonB-dependent receptor [Bacteroides acidifaciens]MCR2006481.1 TonB-dependent receptor [Bacteroides acidifaciens]
MGHFRLNIAFFGLLFCIVFKATANPGTYTISGRITEEKTNTPLPGASIIIKGTYLWAVSNQNGDFTIQGVQEGKCNLEVSFLGYVTTTIRVDIRSNVKGLTIQLKENTLALDDVVITAQAPKSELNTTLIIGSNALEHLQVSNVSDISALLPGGKTKVPDLTTNNVFSLRDGGSTVGNATFGTAVAVDGIRMGNNASFGNMSGIDTRSIAVTNIESVEVITGVPSAEYGDLNSGMINIRTKKGKTPWEILLAINPRTEQFSFSKGLALGNDKGTVNISGEWTKATRKLSSPYTSYTRRGFSANYNNTFRNIFRFNIGFTGNIGGMNTKDDPDAYTGEYTKVRDNVFRANTSFSWLLNKSWITNLKFDASLHYNDNKSHAHTPYTYASEQPAVHAEQEGYFFADKLPYSYFADQIIDSKELDYAASLKYEWNRRFKKVNSNLIAGIQWKSTGNIGEGEYYQNPSLAPNGYRPRPYTAYPYMHNVSLYAEENLTVPLGSTTLRLMAGIRWEKIFISGTEYKNLNTFSPRFNAKWQLNRNISIRGGWGVAEKLPSYYILYPRQEYRDIQTFGVSYNNNESSYVYYSQPYVLLHNKNLRWQRNQNAELGVDIEIAKTKISLVGYFNRTKNPYKYTNAYTPFSYDVLQLPDGFSMPANPQINVNNQTGMVYIRGNESEKWVPMDVKVTNRTFVNSVSPDNGPDINRRGVEMIVDFPEITPIRTQLRLDASYDYMKYIDNSLSYYYQTGWSHTGIPNRSYQYVGIYANGDNSSTTANGKRTHSLDANITAITRIPKARLIISFRLEASLLKRSQNLSEYNGKEYAFNVSDNSNAGTGGSIYDGNSYTAIYPVAYLDLNNEIRPFTEKEAQNSAFANLIRKSGNAYTFAADGYDSYFSANINITKEMGDHVSLALNAINFTNSRKYVTSYATGVSAIFTPDFYYGLTCRIKF